MLIIIIIMDMDIDIYTRQNYRICNFMSNFRITSNKYNCQKWSYLKFFFIFKLKPSILKIIYQI